MANKNKNNVFIFRLYFQFLSCLKLDLKGNNMNFIKNFIAEEDGVTAIEYALIACGISLAIIAAVQGLGSTLNGRYAAVNSSLK